MKKIPALILISILSFQIFCAEKYHSEFIPDEDSYAVYVDSYDWGAGSYKIVINSRRELKPEKFRVKDFSVKVHFCEAGREDTEHVAGPAFGKRNVLDAWISDGLGNKVEGPSHYATILVEPSAADGLTNPYVHGYFPRDISYLYSMKIKNSREHVKISRRSGFVSPSLARMTFGTFKSSEHMRMDFSYWFPENCKGKKIPLIVWFHGNEVAGSNLNRTLLEVPVMNLIGEKIQKYFPDGAAVLIPQCPDSWLVSVEKDYAGNRLWVLVEKEEGVDKLKTELSNALAVFSETRNSKKVSKKESLSYYTDTVKELIDGFVERNEFIDSSRIYAGGDSAGGYMTLNMTGTYPYYFAAGFPVSEVFPNSKLTTAVADQMSVTPMWFSYSKYDSMYDPHEHSISAVSRLKRAGAENIHETAFGNIVDLGGQTNRKGNTVVYNPHRACIYVLNDMAEENGVKMFQWLSEQKLNAGLKTKNSGNKQN